MKRATEQVKQGWKAFAVGILSVVHKDLPEKSVFGNRWKKLRSEPSECLENPLRQNGDQIAKSTCSKAEVGLPGAWEEEWQARRLL